MTMKRKWFSIISIDFIVGFYFWFINFYDELGGLYVTLLSMCISGIVALLLLCFKEKRKTGTYLLYNSLLIIPILFQIIAFCGSLWHDYIRQADDVKYAFCYQNKNFEMVLRRDGSNLFYIDLANVGSSSEVISGVYKKINNQKYILISRINLISTKTGIKERNKNICNDTIIVDNDSLFNLFHIPIPIKKNRGKYRTSINSL